MLLSNCIVVFNKARDLILFCKRNKDPYKGLYNFVGGKVEPGELSETAAYRELKEETGISDQDIQLHRLMDITYYHQQFILEIYVGVLDEDIELKEEANPLVWLSLDEDFTNRYRFAGDQNIAHIINVARMYPIPDRRFRMKGRYIGVDGCKNGWIAAVIKDGILNVYRYDSIQQLIESFPAFDSFLIDMAIGLQDSVNDIRPDDEARKRLSPRSSTVFPVPTRRAVYAEGEQAQKQENLSVLGKSLAKQSMAIIPKIRELDTFLQEHQEYKNVICESHPELCFAMMNGEALRSKKKDFIGFHERTQILSRYLGRKNIEGLWDYATTLKCNTDDVVDAVCLAVTASMKASGEFETIPNEPQKDSRGLLMQMIVPKISK